MIDAAFKALSQMLSPPMRKILWRSIAFALGLLAVAALGLQRLLSWLATSGEQWATTALGPTYNTPLDILWWIISIAAAVGVAVGAIFLMPAVTALIASIFVDDVAEEVERVHYPAERPGAALPISRALVEGIKTALLAIAVYLCAAPFLLLAGLGLVIMFLATAYLLSREYFLLAAMRFHPPDEAKAMRRARSGSIFVAGLPIALFVSIPIVNLASPLFAMAMMVHVHKKLAGRRAELIEPKRA